MFSSFKTRNKLFNSYFDKFSTNSSQIFYYIKFVHVFDRWNYSTGNDWKSNFQNVFFLCYYTMTYKNVQILRFERWLTLSLHFFFFFFIIHAYSIWWRKKRKSKEINIWKRIEHFFDDRKFIVESGNDYINF